MVVVVLTIVLVGINTWGYISRSQLFYDYLFGSFGVVTALLRAPDMFAVMQSTLNSPITYTIFIFLCAVIVALLVYALLEGFKRVAGETSTMWYEFTAHTASASEELRETLTRLSIRAISFVCWALYILFFVNALIPFCSLLLQMSIQAIAASNLLGWVAGLAAFSFLAIGLHLHVTFLRLSFMRPRLFDAS